MEALQRAEAKRARRRRRNLRLPWCPAGPARVMVDLRYGDPQVMAGCGRCGAKFTSGQFGRWWGFPHQSAGAAERHLRDVVWPHAFSLHQP